VVVFTARGRYSHGYDRTAFRVPAPSNLMSHVLAHQRDGACRNEGMHHQGWQCTGQA